MGGLLYHKRGKRGGPSIPEVIIRVVAESGSLLLSNLLPDALAVMGSASALARKTDPRYGIPRGVRRLVERGFLKVGKSKGEEVAVLTPTGKKLLARFRRNELVLKKPKVWDKKWRMVIYDIREERKYLRDELKGILQDLGFIMIQKSVWVYPYPCEDLLAMLKADFRVGKEVLYLVVDRLENDEWVRKHFRLGDKS